MVKEANLEFRLKIDETRNNFLDEIENSYSMGEKYRTTFKYLNYVENGLILSSMIAACVSVSAFASLDCVPVGITSPAVGIKIWAITAGIKKNKLIKKEKKKKHDKKVLSEKLNSIEVLIYKALIDSILVMMNSYQ